MGKLMVYPFDIESISLARHKKLLYDYSIEDLVIPNGWGTSGEDAAIIDYGSEVGINISSDFFDVLEKVETVFFIRPAVELNFEKIIYPKILAAIDRRKNIICSIILSEDIKKSIADKCSINKVKFNYIVEDTNLIKNEQDMIYDINTPVIFVCGNDERTDKYEIQLSLRENFLEDGYNISQIGSKEYSTILGFHSFPDFMYKSNLSEVEKIIAFNHYVKNIEITEKADVIIIGIPFGIMPFDNQFNNNFGVMLYEVSNAIVPDYVILSMTFREYDSQDIDEIKKIMKYKFGCEVDCFNLSNTRIDWNGSKEFLKKIYTKISTKLVDSKANNLKRMGYPVINIFNDIDKNLLYTNLINSLSDNEKITWL